MAPSGLGLLSLSMNAANTWEGDTVIGETTAQAAASEAPEDSLTLAEALSRFEKVYLLNALKKNNWKRGPTADSLGMDRRTLFRKMKDFGLEKE